MQKEIINRLIPLTKWNEYHVWPTIGGLRHLVANAKEKKCESVFVKAGGRWLIAENEFFAWAYSNKEAKK